MKRPQSGDQIPHRGKFTCPFCKGWFSLGDESVAHGEPTCRKFIELDALEFVVEARKQLVGPAPWDPGQEGSN